MSIKFYATQQLLKLADLLRESGQLHVLHSMLNLQGLSYLELITNKFHKVGSVSPHETTL